LVRWSGSLPHSGFDDLARAVERISVTLAAEPGRVLAAKAPESVIQRAAQPLVAGETRVNPKDGLAYVWIPPGKFVVGCSPGDEECFPNEQPPHEVTITRGFWLGQTPVTEPAYARFAKASGSKRASALDLPPGRPRSARGV
jgi:formylglycine-generating enzyme required for sulfatase activity